MKKDKVTEPKLQKLTEVYHGKGRIIESDASKLPTGVLCRVRYPICMIDKKNRNERVYRKAVWERVLADGTLKEKMERRTLFGNQEHPVESALKLNKDDTSHIISNIGMYEKDNSVFADFDVLPTEAGKFISILLEAGCDVGTSTRAEGELEEKIEEATGDKYYEVVPESYQFITVDFTADPSTIGAYPMDIQRNVVDHVKSGYESNRINSEVAVALLEGIKTKEAVALMESIKKIDEGPKQEIPSGLKQEPQPGEKPVIQAKDAGDDPEGNPKDKNNPAVKQVPTAPEGEKVIDTPAKDDPEGAPIDGKTTNADSQGKELKPDDDQDKQIEVGDPGCTPAEDIQGKEGEPPVIPDKKAEELEGAEDPENKPVAKESKSKSVKESFDDMVNFLKGEFKKVKPDMQKKMRSTLSECISAGDIKRRISDLKNEKTIAEAKADKAIEAYDALMENYAKDAVSHTQKIEYLKKAKLNFADKAVGEAKTILEKKAKAEISRLIEAHEKAVSEAQKNFESKLAKAEEAHAKELKEAKAKTDSDIKSLQEAHTKNLLAKYFETKVTVTGLDEHLTKNAATLLEHCVSEGDVDLVVDKLRESIRMGTFSPDIKEVSITKNTSPVQRGINEKVGKILGKLNP